MSKKAIKEDKIEEQNITSEKEDLKKDIVKN